MSGPKTLEILPEEFYKFDLASIRFKMCFKTFEVLKTSKVLILNYYKRSGKSTPFIIG